MKKNLMIMIANVKANTEKSNVYYCTMFADNGHKISII